MATQSDSVLASGHNLIKPVHEVQSKRDSSYYKKRILGYLSSWGSNQYVGGVFEAPNLWSADVIGIKYSGEINEFEIKTSRADLLGEIKAIRRALEPESITITKWSNYDVYTGFERYIVNPTSLSKTKIEKHHHYLVHHQKSFVPNKFYFAVPTHLVDVAVENTKGLVYGVFDADALKIVKRTKSLHREPHTNATYTHLLNRLTVMYRDVSSEKRAVREEVLSRVAHHYNIEFGSVGWLRLMEVMEQYED